MKKLFLFLFALLVFLNFANGAFCAEGDELSTTSFRVDSNGQVYQKVLVEIATTSDTITAAESGKIFMVDINTGYVELTLPDAAAGLVYIIVASSGNQSGDATQGRIYIDPQAADYIYGCVGANDASAFAAGDALYSPSVTGDSVTLVATSDSIWNCIQRTGTWVDGGTGP